MEYRINDSVFQADSPESVMKNISGMEHQIAICRDPHRVHKFVYLDEKWRKYTGQLESAYSSVIIPIISNGIDCVLFRNNRGVTTYGSRTVRYGGMDGSADYFGISYGRHVEIEIKTAVGVQAPNQKSYQKLIEFHRGIYRVLRSGSEAREFVQWLRETK